MRHPRCLCAKCAFFSTPGRDLTDDYDQEKATYFEQREYQTALLKLATQRNIIACLPTGSGKTFIAYKLIEHFQNDITSKGKKVFFLANTIPLVNQQAAFFARNLSLKVKHITGDMEVDYWSPAKWDSIIENYQIIAMTSQIFLNIIRHAYIKFSQVALIIFDECHHAQNEHPMKQVMLEYHTTSKNYPEYVLPRILGLTATIIMGNCKPHEVPARVSDLENTMCATAVTYKDYEAVLRHSTSAKVQPVKIIEIVNSFSHNNYFINKLEEKATELQRFRKERKKLKANVTSIQGIDPTLTSASNIYLCCKPPSAGDLKIAVDDVRRTYLDMGVYCTVIAINLRLAFIEFSLMDLNDNDMKKWYNCVRTLLHEFRSKLMGEMEHYSEEERVIRFVTTKLKKLVELISQNYSVGPISTDCTAQDNENELCGLVFTDRRVTAQVLAWYLKDLAASNTKYAFLKANFVVGTSRSPFETVESRVYARKQTDTINGFRTKKYNLLTATSVLEEGIDVPSCNLVVRFDPVKTYTSYVQSMGRARKKNALFYAFLDDAYYEKGVSNLNNYGKINDAMISHLTAQVMKIDEENSNAFCYAAQYEHSIEPFCPGDSADSPRVTMESATEVIQNYCMLLPSDGISSLQTLSWWTEHPGITSLQYRGHLKLPLNSALRGTTKGNLMSTKELAKQHAFFEAAKLLFEKGALDDRLCPVRPSVPPKIEAFFTGVDPFTATGDEKEVSVRVEYGESNEASGEEATIAKQLLLSRRRDWFPKKIPEIFRGRPLVIGQKYNIHRICMDLTIVNPNCKWPDLYNLESKNTGFGILCAAEEIPNVGSFPLFGGFGCLSVHLEKIPNFSVKLNKQEYHTFRKFQGFVFRDILDITHPLMEEADEISFGVMPLQKDNGTTGWKVHEDFLGKANPGLFTSIDKLRPPKQDARKQNARLNRFQPESAKTARRTQQVNKYYDAVVFPWYKGKMRPLYVVEGVELEMSPKSKFHSGYSSFKDFYKSEYRKEIYDLDQPLLKCKLAGVGKGLKQLNYLLEKYTKEDEFPVYLVPELCWVVPIPASCLVQIKFLPSILHRLFRLLLAKEIVTSVGETCNWAGLQGNDNSRRFQLENMERLVVQQSYDKTKEEERRKTREEIRKNLKRVAKPIPTKKRIADRELHYEFIHPNKITERDIALFHEAVSSQHSAKKLILADHITTELEDGELSVTSKIGLMDSDDVILRPLNPEIDLDLDCGPSLLSVMEAITKFKSNEGVSNDRLKIVGWSFLNCAVSAQIHNQFPTWTEPLMCQLRNRLLSIQVLARIAERKKLGDILSGSGFFPNDVWLPPGFQLIPDVGEIAAEHCIHLGVYSGLSNVKRMSKLELEKHVQVNASKLLEAQLSARPEAGAPKSTKNAEPFIKFATYTHAEVSSAALADGLCAIVGAFFTESGTKGALKALEWFEFTIPDEDGTEHLLGSWSLSEVDDAPITLEKAQSLIPNIHNLEDLIGYRFNNRKFLLEALTHPSHFGNGITDCYQRLEFLGDSILDCLLTNHIFTTHTNLNIENLAEVRAALVNNVTHGSLAVRYGLHKYLLSMSKPLVDMIDNFVVFQENADHRVVGHFTLISDEECWGPKHIEVPKVLGDVFEAIAGAVYLDSGMNLDVVWRIFYRLMQNEIDDFCEDIPQAPTRELMHAFPDQVVFQCCTSQKIRARGREMFKIEVAHLGHYFGTGTNKTRAKEAAAKLALKICKEDDSNLAKFDGAKILIMT